MGKNERWCQRTHVQNPAYANKSSRTYVRDVRSLSKPECLLSFQKRKTDAVIERSKKSVIGQLKTSPVKVTWSECFTYKTRNCINKIHD